MFHQFHKLQLVRLLYSTVFAIVLVLGMSRTVLAATLYISPASSAVDVGNIITVRALVNTGPIAINNVDGSVQFSSDLLQVLSISKSSSIFTLWVEEPKFSNHAGSITFNGGVPNPGYVGQGGEIISITFKAISPGNATLAFTNSAVRANDGLGTDVLSTKSPAVISVKSVNQTNIPVGGTNKGLPIAPLVTSTTHPNQNKWYDVSDVELAWDIPNDITAVSTSVGKSPTSDPTVIYDPPIGNKKIPNLEDGIWYFHVRFKNKVGWGPVTHFKMQIDTIAPNSFKIVFPHGNVTDEPRPVVNFNTTDNLSGVSYYEVRVGEGQFSRVITEDVKSNPYSTLPQEPGLHDIFVKAVDMAGNETVQTSKFTISSINIPQITEYTADLKDGDLFRVRGTSYPQTTVEIVVEDSFGRKTNQISDTLSSGEFTSVWVKGLDTGSYKFMIRAIDKRGAKSDFSQPFSFAVNRSSFSSVSSIVLNWLSLLIIILLILALIGIIITYFTRHIIKIRRSLNRKIKIAESSIHKAFHILRENVREQIKTLEETSSKRELTREEEKIIKRLQESLTKSEATLEKEIGEIEESISK